MPNLSNNIGHIVTTVLVIIAVTALAWHGTITGGEALTIIGVLSGVSVGGSVASSSGGAPTPGSASTPASTGVGTSAPIPAQNANATTTTSPAPTNPGSVV